MTDYPLLNVFWSILIFFGFILWFTLAIGVFYDNFRRSDHSGWAKAGWTILIFLVPVLGVLVYMIARPPKEPIGAPLAKEKIERVPGHEEKKAEEAGASVVDQIARLQQLREKGAISDEEYEKLKQRAMAA